jgi:hypothetical protein
MTKDIRIVLRTEIESTLEKFQRLLVAIPEPALSLPSKDPGSTNGELLLRMSVSPLAIKACLKQNLGSWSYLSLPRLVTGPLTQRRGEFFIRSHARDLTLWFLAKEYQENCTTILEMLDEISEDEFEKILVIPDGDPLLQGQVTVEQLFHYVRNYFDAHRKQINLGR